MTDDKSKKILIIDRLIFGFVILFLLSLTVSIFVNQLGYYGALLLILIRYAVTRENQFKKTGLEVFFGLFLFAEILSAFFSNEHGHAFTNFTRRLLLIPTFYTITVAADDLKKAKLFFKVFIGASMVSIIVYLAGSYYYYIYNLYQIEESGPALFQYPITTSEIMSFTVIFLFAFLLNEKQSFKYKLLISVLFILSALALFSTYKRTGWIGTAAGLFIIILIKRNWKLIIPIVCVFIALIFIEKNKSEVYIYKTDSAKIYQTAKLNTQGRPYDVFPDSTSVYVSDFENGILRLKGSNITGRTSLPGAVVQMDQWGNKLLAYLIDTRFILLNKNSLGDLHQAGELFSPGFTVSYRLANGFLYVMDKDSGLTVFRNPENVKEKSRFESLKSQGQIYVDSAKLFFYDEEKQALIQYRLKNGLPETGEFKSIKLEVKPSYLFYSSSHLIVSAKGGLMLYRYDSEKPVLKDHTSDIKNVYNISHSSDRLIITDLNKNVYLLKYPLGDSLQVLSKLIPGFVAKSAGVSGSYLYLTNVRRSRITSIFDPYIPSNFNRIALWRAGLLMLKDHPLFGVGDIDLNNLYRQYKRPYDKELQGHLHNNYIHFLAILGIFGFIAVMLLLGKIIILNQKIYRSLKDVPFASSYALGTIGGFIAFLCAGLTEWNFGDHEVITLVWFTLGLNLAFYFIITRMKKEDKEIITSDESRETIVKG